jgi:hypothetical protein
MVGLAKLVFQLTLDPGTGESEKGSCYEIQSLGGGDRRRTVYRFLNRPRLAFQLATCPAHGVLEPVVDLLGGQSNSLKISDKGIELTSLNFASTSTSGPDSTSGGIPNLTINSDAFSKANFLASPRMDP